MSFQNIPVIVVFHRDENGDDDDSLISFITGSSSTFESDRESAPVRTDSKSRWVTLQRQQRRRGSAEGPHHPQRSLSINNDTNATSKEVRRVSLPTRVTAKRTNRLLRMQERAKASARSPVCRRYSFQRHCLPASNSWNSPVSCPRPLCSKSSYSSHCSSSFSKSPMNPRRHNSTQCILQQKQKQHKRERLICPSRTTGRGLEALILQQAQPLTGIIDPANRRVAACLKVACAAAANTSRPPRLPQRYPSEAAPQIPASN